eukprot:maker-scaffold_96-snap-gene-0.0-mRNA-1 protein AED:0.26 eAED:0.26 QI:0/0.25/0.2/1/0/0/5/218/86
MIVLLSVTAKVPALLLLLTFLSENIYHNVRSGSWSIFYLYLRLGFYQPSCNLRPCFAEDSAVSSAKAKYLRVWLCKLVPCKSQDRG